MNRVNLLTDSGRKGGLPRRLVVLLAFFAGATGWGHLLAASAMVDSLWFEGPMLAAGGGDVVMEVCSGTVVEDLVVYSSVPGDSVFWSISYPGSVEGVVQSTGAGLDSAVIALGTLTNLSTSTQDVVVAASSLAAPAAEASCSVEIAPVIEIFLGPLPASDTICSGEQVFALVNATVHNVDVKWLPQADSNVVGAADGAGPLIYDVLENTSTSLGAVHYQLYTPFEACPADTFEYTVVVVPEFALPALGDSVLGCAGTVVDVPEYAVQVTDLAYGWVVEGDAVGVEGQGTEYLDTLVLANATDALAEATIYLTGGLAHCMDQTPFHVQVHPIPELELTLPAPTACSGQPLDALLTCNLDSLALHWDASGNVLGPTDGNAVHEAHWVDSLVNLQPFADTVHYTVWVGDYVCPTDTAVFSIPVAPTLSLPEQPDLRLCPGDSVDLVDFDLGLDNVTYEWSTPSGEVYGLPATGTDVLLPWVADQPSDSEAALASLWVVADFEGCRDSSGFEVRVDPVPVPSVGGVPSLMCNHAPVDGQLAATVDTAVIHWAPWVTGGLAGMTTGEGALLMDTLTNPGAAVASAFYQIWTTGTFCASDTLVWPVAVLPDYTLPDLPPAQWCNGDAASVEGLVLSVPGGEYVWSHDNPALGLPQEGTGNDIAWIASNATAAATLTTFSVEAAIAPCPVVTTTFEVTVHPTPELAATVSPNNGIDCVTGTGFIEGEASTGTGSYTWTGPEVLGGEASWVEVGEAGSYDMTFVDDATGCMASLDVAVLPPTPAEIVSWAWDTLICPGETDGWIAVEAVDSAALVYTWEPPVSAGALATGVGEGAYRVWVTNASNCVDSAVVEVVDIDSLSAEVLDAGLAVCGQPNGYVEVEAAGGWGELTVQWEGAAEPDPLLWGAPSGWQVVQVTDAHGCTAEFEFEVECLPEIPVGAVQLVTPNSDGHNDVWSVEDLYLYPNHEVRVFNRWGTCVYEAAPYENDWAGTWEAAGGDGSPLPSGTYFYLFNPREEWAPKFRGFIEIMNDSR